MLNFDGLSPQMLLALADDGIKNVEEFAKCADWELAGGWTTVDGERVKDDGLLETFGVTLEEDPRSNYDSTSYSGMGKPR